MKRALSIFLTLCLTLGLLAGCGKKEEPAPAPAPAPAPVADPTPAPAPEPEPEPEAEPTSFTEVGIDMSAAAAQPEIKGAVLWDPYGSINREPDVFLLRLLYFAMPQAEFDELNEKYDNDTATEEEVNRLMDSYDEIGYLVASTGSKEETVEDVLYEDPDTAVEIGSADGYTFWFVPLSAEGYFSDIDAVYADDARSLQAKLPELLKGSGFYAPIDPMDVLAGQVIRFETTDLDGNPVTSEELFAQNEITMVNVWATWCGPCVGELGELAELHERLRAKNCGVIGIAEDGAESPEEAKSLIAENGVKYPIVISSDDMDFLDNVSAIPTSFFVDKNGVILNTPIVGAMVDAYEPTVDRLLDGGAASAPAAAAGVYRIFVKDADGNAVEGVKVQFCNDDECRFVTTGADGLASFEAAPGTYTVHLLKVPAGYVSDDMEYVMTESGDLTITVNKQ